MCLGFGLVARRADETGASAEDIKETLFHVAVYAGVPAANRAFAIAKTTLMEAGDMTEPGNEA